MTSYYQDQNQLKDSKSFVPKVDVRGKPLSEARHQSRDFGQRAYFRMSIQEPAVLVINKIKSHEAAVYRCRVDFNKGQSRSARYNVTVIVPPEQPAIMDMWGRQLNGTAGPYEEGDNLSLTCRVTGGRPEPTVKWIVNGQLKDDDAYESTAGDVIEKKITVKSLTRSHLFSNFTCQAQNTHLVQPKKVSLILDLNLKPLTVTIRKTNGQDFENEALKAGERYEVECETTGSKPPAVITWYKGRRPLIHVKGTMNTENRTISRVEFVPGVDDDGKSVTCRAENPNVTGLYLETSWRINVVYAPIVSLRLGTSLNAGDIKEGDDVYFECQIKANPSWSKLTWIHNGVVLTHNTSARIIRSNQSLVLQSVTRSSAGLYVCAATNDIQETRSKPLEFRVKYAPICKEDKIMVVGASRGESLEISCRVEADPPAHSFRWKFNNSGETLELPAKLFSIDPNDGLSVLTYEPSTELDYGTLSCWADNLVGTQSRPCLFQLVAAGKPFPVRNCSLANQTYTSVEVRCIAGYDGGLPQEFVLEVYHGDLDSLASLRSLYNVTAKEEPFFELSGLKASVDAGTHVVVYAINAKGRSQPIVLSEVTFRDAERRTGQDAGMGLSPLMGVIIGALVTLALVLLVLLVKSSRPS
ncbi:synaptogenesis protein syg-2 [Copidosoma floridanum]|uniref:synaptogenesis protein syg-2 n=1 Tax=Copidosoma floridanum TaxID=29053 RepID=UPI000C6F5BA9|nr:synaptogenesis protein syg-2 [Copidosoma floridanum]